MVVRVLDVGVMCVSVEQMGEGAGGCQRHILGPVVLVLSPRWCWWVQATLLLPLVRWQSMEGDSRWSCRHQHWRGAHMQHWGCPASRTL
jgi:hypothetical protein